MIARDIIFSTVHTFSIPEENKSELIEVMKMNVTCTCFCENLCNCKLCKYCISCVMKCKCSNLQKSSNEIILPFIQRYKFNKNNNCFVGSWNVCAYLCIRCIRCITLKQINVWSRIN